MNNINKPAQNKYFFLAFSLALVHFLLGLDINIVSVTLPSVAEHFRISPSDAARIVWVYFLVLTTLLIGFGRLGDLKGFKKLYITGIIVFTLGSFLSAIAFDFNFLLAARIFQSIGGAILFALTPAIISKFVPESKRGRVFGFNYMFVAFGGVIGRGLSGYLIQYLGWNSIFLINLPFGIAAVILCYFAIPAEEKTESRFKFDFAGAIIIFIALASLLLAINLLPQFGIASNIIISLFAIFIISAISFYLYEKKSPSPVFNLNNLKNKNILFPVLSFFFVYVITNGMIFLFPFYLQWLQGYSKTETGLIMTIPSILQIIFGYLSGYLSEKRDIRRITINALILIAISYLMFTYLDDVSIRIYIFGSLVLFGLSIGLFIPANTNGIMQNASVDEKGSVSSFMTTVIRIGSAFGVTIFSSMLAFYVPEKDPVAAKVPVDRIVDGFKYAFAFGFFMIFIAYLFRFAAKKEGDKRVS